MTLNWRQRDYFESLLAQPEENEAHVALELLVDDIHKDKAKTIAAFLDHYGSEDFLWGIVRLLAADNSRVAGNAAYIFGTLAEDDIGQVRVMSLINGPSPHAILANLFKMLDYNDTECVMNAAGTMGTLAESKDGREWMLRESCLDPLLKKITTLLSSTNMWTASNAALVLARISISEEGCKRLLGHINSLQILTCLIDSLGMDEAGRGMNAAFAIGRLCDIESGRHRLLNHRDSEKMLNSLCCMLASKDSGCGKNACYALSCLASSDQGHKRLLLHTNSELMLHLLAQQLGNGDSETAWFAAMTLRTLAGKRQGVLRMRNHTDVVPLLKQTSLKPGLSSDLLEEVDMTLELLKHLARPEAPRLEVKGPHEIEVTWPVIELKSGLPVTYSLYRDGKKIYKGDETSQLVSNLRPFTKYSFKLQVHTEGDDSPHSNESFAKTQDAPPDAPEALRVLGMTISQIRIGWAPPQYNNGGLKGYIVYNGKHQVETTCELNSILSGLAPGTTYQISVCAFNHKGKGPKASFSATTEELGKHAPRKLTLTSRGRSQIHVTWAPPEFPLGRLYRFELTTNGKVVYSGTDLSYTVKQLTPNTEYSFTVSAVTSEGKCETEPAKKKTGKDEYNVQSTAPVFFSHPTKVSLETKPSSKHKDKSHPRSASRHNKRRESSKPSRSLISPSSYDASTSRPVSATSSSWSGHRKKRSIKSGRKQVDSGLSTTDARRNRHIAALKEMERSQKSSTGEESSDWSEEDSRWSSSVYQQDQVDGSNLEPDLGPQGDAQPKTCSDPEFLSVTVSYRENSNDESPRESKVGSAESQESRRQQQLLSRKDVTFDENVFKSMKEKERKAHVHDAALKELVRDLPPDLADKRALLRMSLSMKRQRTAPGVEREGLKYPGDVLANPPARTGRMYQTRTQEALSKRRQLDSLAHDSRLSFNPARAMHDLRLNDQTELSRDGAQGSMGENRDFTLMANGIVLYQEKVELQPDSADRASQRRSPRKSDHEDAIDVERLPNDLLDPSPREMGSLRGSWNEDEGFGVSDSDDEDRLTGMAQTLADDHMTKSSGYSHRGERVSTGSRSAKKDVLSSKNPLMEQALPSRSALVDHSSFYQRANTFISSHRPTLKKNLARLVAPGAHNMPQFASQMTYDPEFPASKKPGGANKYQFIPTQFRTQPVNLPTPLLPRGNTLASLQDRSAFVRKLEALSQMSSGDSRTPPFCNDCGREQEPRGVPLRYSHRNDSHPYQMNAPRRKSGRTEIMSHPVAR